MSKSAGTISARIFLVLVASLIVFLSHQPSLKPPVQLFPHQDKVFHLLEFGGLGLAMIFNSDLFGKKRPKLTMGVAGTAWAVLDELHQSFVPGRDCSFQDLLADVAGVLIAVWLFSHLFTRREKHPIT